MTPKPPIIIAIDHGTSGIKTSLVDACGTVIATESANLPTDFLGHGCVEQDPTLWWTALLRTAKRVIESTAIVAAAEIKAVSVSSTFSSTVAVDDDGLPVMPCMTWMDTRGAPYVQALMRGIPSFDGYGIAKALRWIHRTAGAPTLSGKDDLAHALYIKHERPELYAKTAKFLPSKDFLNLKLTGRAVATTDSVTLFWLTNTRRLDHIEYDPKLLKASGLDRKKLPDLIRPTDVVGTLLPDVAQQLGISVDTVVFGGSPDHQAAAIGSGAVEDFHGHLYVGTSSWIQCHVPFKKTDIIHSIASLPTAIPDRYYAANEQDLAGGCLSYLMDNVLFYDNGLTPGMIADDPYAILDRIAESVEPGSGNLLFMPWLNGERTPVDDHTLRGSLFNLSTTSTQNEIIRAVLEGVALNTRWAMTYVERFIGRRMERLNFVGGGALSDIWCQIFADVLQRTIQRVDNPRQANARGAAYIALVGMGLISFSDIERLVRIEKIFEPQARNAALYDKLYRAFVDFYRRNKSLYKMLNSPSQ